MVQHESLLELLRRTQLFHDLETPMLHLVAQQLTEHTYDDGEIVFHEGDTGDRLFLLLSGAMQVFVERDAHTITYATLQPGECFGEMALIEDRTRSATVRAQAPSRCCTLSKQDFLDLIQRDPHIALEVMRSLSRRLRQASIRLQDSSSTTPHGT
jgi:CRP/FNR family transcriptional regulator, cyclic AMP receptor protein